MKKFFAIVLVLGIVGSYPVFAFAQVEEGSAAPASFASLLSQVEEMMQKLSTLRNQVRMLALQQPMEARVVSGQKWQVALQVGHWNMEELPWELRKLSPLRQAQGGGKMEWEVNLAIAQRTAEQLRAQGIGVTILSAALPSIYKADAFVAIHADQNPNLPYASGFKVAASAFDQSGKASRLARLLQEEYQKETWLSLETYIPKTMPYYYAFNSEKFTFAIHPTTPSVIIETGYLPNIRDQLIISKHPEVAAKGIAQGILKFLREE